jgi:hypothetical protein
VSYIESYQSVLSLTLLQTTESEINLIYPLINKSNLIFEMADMPFNSDSISYKQFDWLSIDIPPFYSGFQHPWCINDLLDFDFPDYNERGIRNRNNALLRLWNTWDKNITEFSYKQDWQNWENIYVNILAELWVYDLKYMFS